jgi:hypothetical protein
MARVARRIDVIRVAAAATCSPLDGLVDIDRQRFILESIHREVNQTARENDAHAGGNG